MSESDYKRRHEAFSMDVEFAVRVWHSHIHLHNRCAKEPALVAALGHVDKLLCQSLMEAMLMKPRNERAVLS